MRVCEERGWGIILCAASRLGGRLARRAMEDHNEVVISYRFPFTCPFRLRVGNILCSCQFQVTSGLLLDSPSPALPHDE